ncbi:myogenesis-regulating glycosidase-like isoform X2 [Plodia interpunctella]|uniref:myogenesis-regulating glycosidase-like isoform X2 n=1 Tax=Plodia interpunctella TaxID=58824 RepID=UPI0023688238|nr:myogenesis-regulating glycosidase-like isoform X2 [Plodia interpunctella]
MMKLFLVLLGIGIASCAVPKDQKTRDFHVEADDNGDWTLNVITDGVTSVLGTIGRGVPKDKVTFEMSESRDEASGGYRLSIRWDGPPDVVFEDCFDFKDRQWFGGPQQKQQYWPIQNGRLNKYSMVSKEEDNAAVSEKYWLNSAGHYIYIYPETPLFVDYHNILDNHVCFIAEVAAPYSSKREHNNLKYDFWFFDDPKTAHQHAVDTYLGKPTGIPDRRMIELPVWSTWARYSREIDQENVLEFAKEIADSGFPNAQFDIDDLWEICYGSLTVQEDKFPDMKKLVQDLKDLGFRVTIWVHPFINKNCEPWYSEALNNGYLVLNEEGGADTSWWNNNGSVASYIDFTKPAAGAWFRDRLRSLVDTYGIDSLKFDAGESSWSPQIPVQNGDIDLHPGNIVEDYLRLVAEFGNMIEVRSGMRTQDLPIFIRMVDKDTLWDWDNGLYTLITTLLQMNLNGYTLVLPDMIGGNGYNAKPSKELFVRWAQANVFMPSLQFSFVPWDHDDEAVEICLRYVKLHAAYTDDIIAAMEASVRDGTPVNPPIWWIDPTDPVALAVWDEFLLGEKILAAPVVEEGAVSRNIYLPKGTWRDGVSGELHQGPLWLNDYPAPLDTLPYFTLEN